MRTLSLIALTLVGFVSFAVSDATAQPMINQSVPFQNLGSSFFENNGVTWNLQGPGFFINSGGNNVVPPFGNPDPNSGLSTGVGFRRGQYSGNIGLNLSQGSNRSNVSTTPSVTTMNGVPGTITDQTMRPFVTSVTPVLGGQALLPSGPPRNEGADRLQGYANAQQAELQQRMQANFDAKQKKAYADFKRGLQAEEEEDLRKARANYRRALQVATGPLRLEVMKRMHARGWLR